MLTKPDRHKPGRLRQQLDTHEPVVGYFMCTGEPVFVEIMGTSGFDFVAFDTEHGRLNIETIEHLTRAAEVTGLSSLVRFPKDDYNLALRCLEAGAEGLIMTHCCSSSDVRKLIDTMKFSPIGRRGYATNTRANDYGQNAPSNYITAANDNLIVGVMIEDSEAVQNIDDILNVDGLDLIIIGFGDLSASCGVPTQFDHPKVLEAAEAVVAACAAHSNITLGVFVEDAKEIPSWLEKGASFYVYLSEVDLFRNACAEAVKQFKAVIPDSNQKSVR